MDTNPQHVPIPLSWCDTCRSFTHRGLGHSCRDTFERHLVINHLAADRYDRKQRHKVAYAQYVRAEARRRRMRAAA